MSFHETTELGETVTALLPMSQRCRCWCVGVNHFINRRYKGSQHCKSVKRLESVRQDKVKCKPLLSNLTGEEETRFQ